MTNSKFDTLVLFGTILAVTLFLVHWTAIFTLKSRKKPTGYSIVVFDVNGNRTTLQGIRTQFHNYDVAWSFAQFYKELFVLHNFGVASEDKSPKLTLVRYI